MLLNKTIKCDAPLVTKAEAIGLLKPIASPFELIMLGGESDGAYLIPNDLKGISSCFSPGVSDRKDFEDQLANDYGIITHLCDKSADENWVSESLIPGKQTFKKLWLSDQTGEDSISLADWVDELSPDAQRDLLLQMDIEGAEYKVIMGLTETLLSRFRIIVIEFHGLCNPIQFWDTHICPTLSILSKTHRCVHISPNNCCGQVLDRDSGLNIPNCVEATFLRSDRFDLTPLENHYPPQAPHPKEVWNIRSFEPIFLNEGWISPHKRSADSSLTMYKYISEYLQYKCDILDRALTTTSEAFSNRIHNLASAPVLDESFDLAAGKHYFLGCPRGGTAKSGIIESKSPFIFETAYGMRQYVTIDLGEDTHIQYLRIHNRTDGHFSRAKHLCCVTHCEKNIFDEKCFIPLSVNEGFLSSGTCPSLTYVGSTGRYLSIVSLAITSLSFSRIEIY